MKTELSISATVSRAAEQLARQMGMTLDEFFALDPVIAKLQASSIRGEEW